MIHARWIPVLLGLLAALPARAEPVVVEADAYLDVVGGRIVSPAVVVVEGEKIVAVNPAARPAGAKTISLAGHTLLPGLMVPTYTSTTSSEKAGRPNRSATPPAISRCARSRMRKGRCWPGSRPYATLAPASVSPMSR
jgi:hypothetical protein